jgi:predicted enzyme related to lactoylglutathione lyase
MSQAPHNHQIDYIELPVLDIPKTKAFYATVFGWKFEDYGPDYTSFSDGRLSGGFNKDAPLPVKGILVVITRAIWKARNRRSRLPAQPSRKRSSHFPAAAAFTSWIRAEMN